MTLRMVSCKGDGRTIRTRIRTWLLERPVNKSDEIDVSRITGLYLFFELPVVILILIPMIWNQLPSYLCSWFELWFYEIAPLERRKILADKYELAQILFSFNKWRIS
jgi:hypothetical protein